jgi:hypothetical protein
MIRILHLSTEFLLVTDRVFHYLNKNESFGFGLERVFHQGQYLYFHVALLITSQLAVSLLRDASRQTFWKHFFLQFLTHLKRILNFQIHPHISATTRSALDLRTIISTMFMCMTSFFAVVYVGDFFILYIFDILLLLSPNNLLFFLSKLKLLYDWWSVSQSVCRGVEPTLGLVTR